MASIHSSDQRKISAPIPQKVKETILKAEEPLVFRNFITWDAVSWKIEDWMKILKDKQLEVRMGTAQCTKVPQWENSCETMSVSLTDLMDDNLQSTGTWMYFDYKHMKHHFKDNYDFLESLSWRDIGYPEKDGKDSTIWIGSQGAYTPCHMDSYGCNIVAQVHGRKLWVLFPPNRTAVMKPTRVPYEESSVYSNINFSCGLNVSQELGDARVVELGPGDMMIVPRHWWHYVENLSTAISINTWIPLEADHRSRLDESLVRFFIALIMKNPDAEGVANILNPNEEDLLDEPVDLRQVSWCLGQLERSHTSIRSEATTASTLLPEHPIIPPKPTTASTLSPEHSSIQPEAIPVSTLTSVNPPITPEAIPVSTLTSGQLKERLLAKCGCVDHTDLRQTPRTPSYPLSMVKIIDAFCHPEVISKVADILLSTKDASNNI